MRLPFTKSMVCALAVLGILVLVLLIAGIAGCAGCAGCAGNSSPTGTPSKDAVESAAAPVTITIECEENLVFSRYDLNVYVDDSLLGSLDHGATKDFEATLEEGSHVLRVANKGDDSVDGSIDFVVEDDTPLTFVVACTNSEVMIVQAGTVNPPLASSDVVGKNYEDVQRAFWDAGFAFVSTEEVRDLSLAEQDRNWLVSGVSIDGMSDFGLDDTFAANSEVVVTYHVLADLKPPASSSEIEGMNYADAEQLFKEAGFTNVTTSAVGGPGAQGIVSRVTIGGATFGTSDFSADETFAFDAEVIISYYEGDDAPTSGPQSTSGQTVPAEELNTLLTSSSTNAAWFTSAYEGATITFDGWVANMMHHEGYTTRWDVLILAGTNGVSPSLGPNFRLTDVNFSDMNVTNSDTLAAGNNITITAVVGKYNATSDWLELDPVSITLR